jgi:hypothetical protein
MGLPSLCAVAHGSIEQQTIIVTMEAVRCKRLGKVSDLFSI